MKQREKSKLRRRVLILAALVLILAALMLLRHVDPEEQTEPTPTPQVAAEPSREPVPDADPESTAEPEPTSAPTPALTPPPPPTPGPTPAPVIRELKYDEKTYHEVTEMVFAYRNYKERGETQIQAAIERLKALDPDLGEAWEGIMSCWAYVNTDLEPNLGGPLPDDLPQDNSLGIVVLGYELLYDGDMAPEMLGRCELALQCADQYPCAYLILCGGGTAIKNKDITEAEVMANWLKEHGVDKERLILEDKSMTTGENAKNACTILSEQYPQIKQLALVTSGYHMPISVLMFTEAALLRGYETGQVPYTVVANCALDVPGTLEFAGMTSQSQYVWTLADPHY